MPVSPINPKHQEIKMADPKDQPRHGRDTAGKDDPARTRPFEMNEPRSKEEIVQQAYDHEDPTPTQEENDAAKLAALNLTPPEGEGGEAEAARQKKEREQKELEGQRSGGYQTRASTANPIPPNPNAPKAG